MTLWQRLLTALIGPLASACAAVQSGDRASWAEEVLLHDGSKLTLQRSQVRGGRHEIGQEVPIAEHTVSFSVPNSKTITWLSQYGLEIEKSSLLLLALDVIRGQPYILTYPVGCVAYNKWSRPNPPYVAFRFDGSAWQRMDVAALPPEITQANVVVSTQRYEQRLAASGHPISSEEIRQLNETPNPDFEYLRLFVRHPIQSREAATCPEMVYDGKGGWQSRGGYKAPETK